MKTGNLVSYTGHWYYNDEPELGFLISKGKFLNTSPEV